MNEFKTKKEASKELEKLQEEATRKFCPATNSYCRKDCVSFYKGMVVESKNKDAKKVYKIFVPQCTFVLISGDIYIES